MKKRDRDHNFKHKQQQEAARLILHMNKFFITHKTGSMYNTLY